MTEPAPSLSDVFDRRPPELQRIREKWLARRQPEGTVLRPPGLPPCGTDPRSSRHNRAADWLRHRGWISARRLARLLNINRQALRKHFYRGRIPYLRVGECSWWVPREAVPRAFARFGDPEAHAAWVAAGRPLPEAG